MSERDRLIQELISLIEDNDVAWRKAAFYSDPRVEPIYERLIKAWLDSGEKGIPLDYASEDELRELVLVARKYAFMSEDKARSLAMARMSGGEGEFEGFGKFIKRLLGR